MDHIRVLLCFNAQGYRQRDAFIATQGPMNNTCGDFWRMVWEQKSAAVVMLTQLEEDGIVRIPVYWPACMVCFLLQLHVWLNG